MRHVLVGGLLAALGGLGVLWQVDQATSTARAAAPALLCPLGGHGDVSARLDDPFARR